MKLPLSHPLHLVMGLTIWILWLSAVYGGLSVACVVAPPPEAQGPLTWINAALLVVTVLTTAALAVLAWRAWRAPVGEDHYPRQQRFAQRVSAAVYLAGALATLAVGLPVIALPPCI